VFLIAAVSAACARKPAVMAPVVATPRFPEFVRPTVPATFANTPAADSEARGWAFLQSGDLKNAEREFSTALKLAPSFYPAEASLGYVELARKDAKAALPRFDRALQTHSSDVASLMGRGQALVALDRDDEALTAFEAAVKADPSLSDVSRRVEVMRFRGAERTVDRARHATRAGQLDEAIRLYTAALATSPDSPFLYRELALVERQKGQAEDALGHFRKAVALDPSDARSFTQIGELLASRDDFPGAEQAYTAAATLEPSADLEKRLADVRTRTALARLPAEYRALDQAVQITRGDLAALIGIRLGSLLAGGRRADAALMTDVRNHWAATWILAVAGAGVIEPFANHAFQPRSIVRRTDFAQAIARLLPRAAHDPGQLRTWESARLRFNDLSATHLAYPAASAAVASGVMKTAADNAFQPSRPVTGPEALEAIGRLEALAGLK
jgi:tetratricopeptide (TPR) repeat protein